MKESVNALKKLYLYKTTIANTVAVVDKCGERKTTYNEFVTIVNSIAYYLKTRNIGIGDVVAIELGRCMEHYATRVACHFIGAVFLDINLNIPENRKRSIYNDCKPKITVNDKVLSEIIIKEYECQINEELKDSDNGYIVYTSGSTGTPKGILHDRSIYELYTYFYEYICLPNYELKTLKNNMIHAALADFSFVISMIDMLFLYECGTIHIVDSKILGDVYNLKEYIKKIISHQHLYYQAYYTQYYR